MNYAKHYYLVGYCPKAMNNCPNVMKNYLDDSCLTMMKTSVVRALVGYATMIHLLPTLNCVCYLKLSYMSAMNCCCCTFSFRGSNLVCYMTKIPHLYRIVNRFVTMALHLILNSKIHFAYLMDVNRSL